MRRALRLALLACALALLGAPTALAEEWGPMPNLIGKTLAEARALLRAAGIVSEIESRTGRAECDGDAPPEVGKIHCQSPGPGASVNRHAPVQVQIYEAPTHAGEILREQLATLVGLPVEQAKQELKRMGHDGEVIIDVLLNFSKSCGLDKVCGVQPVIGTGVHDPVRLQVNPRAKIAVPQ